MKTRKQGTSHTFTGFLYCRFFSCSFVFVRARVKNRRHNHSRQLREIDLGIEHYLGFKQLIPGESFP